MTFYRPIYHRACKKYSLQTFAISQFNAAVLFGRSIVRFPCNKFKNASTRFEPRILSNWLFLLSAYPFPPLSISQHRPNAKRALLASSFSSFLGEKKKTKKNKYISSSLLFRSSFPMHFSTPLVLLICGKPKYGLRKYRSLNRLYLQYPPFSILFIFSLLLLSFLTYYLVFRRETTITHR